MEIENNNSYIKFIKVLSIIYEKASQENPISTSEIKKILFDNYYETIDKRTITKIIESFNTAQDDYFINTEKNRYYFNATPTFELGEAKALVDMVYSSKSFPEYIKQLFLERMQSFFNPREAKMLEKVLDIHVSGNETDSLFNTVLAKIAEAIHEQRKISFDYIKKTPIDSKPYKEKKDNIWPIETSCSNNTFYVHCFDENEDETRTFRIDFMANIILKDNYTLTPQLKEEIRKGIINSTTGYVPSEEDYKDLELTFNKKYYTNIIDLLGRNLKNITYVDKNHYSILINKCPTTNTFYGWLIGFGGEIKITGPESEVKEFENFLRNNFLS